MNRVSVIAAIALLAAACGGSSPSRPADGTYTGYAASDGSVPAGTLLVDGESYVLDIGGSSQEGRLTESDTQYVVCPPDGEATVEQMGAALTIGDLTFTTPAVFGDCGETAPVRVTIVDVATADMDMAFPFITWVELCDTTDPDC